MSGTSMACPHVAGVLALGLSANPSLTRDDLLQCLYGTAINVDARNPGYQNKLGAGLVDAAAFVACCNPMDVVFPATGVMIYHGSDRTNKYCETNPNQVHARDGQRYE